MRAWNRSVLVRSPFLRAAAPEASRLQRFQRPLSISSRNSFQRPKLSCPRLAIHHPLRHNTTQAATLANGDLSKSTPDASSADQEAPAEQPVYELTFTCRPCNERSTHRISKHGYHQGSVLIACPNCKSRHVISDHLRIFSEGKVTLEELLAKNGEMLKRGTLNQEGDIEIWDDGTGRYVPPAAKPEEDFAHLEEGYRHKPSF